MLNICSVVFVIVGKNFAILLVFDIFGNWSRILFVKNTIELLLCSHINKNNFKALIFSPALK